MNSFVWFTAQKGKLMVFRIQIWYRTQQHNVLTLFLRILRLQYHLLDIVLKIQINIRFHYLSFIAHLKIFGKISRKATSMEHGPKKLLCFPNLLKKLVFNLKLEKKLFKRPFTIYLRDVFNNTCHYNSQTNFFLVDVKLISIKTVFI